MLLGNGDLLGNGRAARTDRPAVRVGDEELYRADLWAAAAAVAGRIGGAPAVAVHGDASLRTVVAVVGGILAGVPVVPVPADAGGEERRHILRDSGAALWIGPELAEVELPAVPVDPAERAPGAVLPPDPGPEATALIMYTSGTTGAPKGALVSRRAVAAGLDGLGAAWDWGPDDVLVHGLPLFHVHGLVLGVLGALRLGSPLIHTVRPRPEAYARAAGEGGTLFFGVPTVWSRIAADADSAAALSAARLLVSGSAALPESVAQSLSSSIGQAVVERYGMTETLITLAARADEPPRTGWVGRPIEGVQARLRTDSGAPVPADGESIGNLQLRGDTLFSGYLGRPEATAESFTADGWFMTGDAAVADAGGLFRIVGRTSVDLIKSGGYRVGAGEVEAALLDHPSVREAAVVGVPDDDLGQRIVAVLVGDSVDAADVTDFVAQRLSVHKRPREVRVVDALPRNAMGKVQKKALM
ncbi:acyl-CoA synthetase [Nocardiopsis coralliicola]